MFFEVILLTEFEFVARFPPSGKISEIFDVGSTALSRRLTAGHDSTLFTFIRSKRFLLVCYRKAIDQNNVEISVQSIFVMFVGGTSSPRREKL